MDGRRLPKFVTGVAPIGAVATLHRANELRIEEFNFSCRLISCAASVLSLVLVFMELKMRTGIIVALLVASLGLVACRREVPYEPLKLGGPADAVERPAH